jgi:hypothetical protein
MGLWSTPHTPRMTQHAATIAWSRVYLPGRDRCPDHKWRSDNEEPCGTLACKAVRQTEPVLLVLLWPPSCAMASHAPHHIRPRREMGASDVSLEIDAVRQFVIPYFRDFAWQVMRKTRKRAWLRGRRAPGPHRERWGYDPLRGGTVASDR